MPQNQNQRPVQIHVDRLNNGVLVAQIQQCWEFVLVALLLIQISMFVKLETMFQHIYGISTGCWV